MMDTIFGRKILEATKNNDYDLINILHKRKLVGIFRIMKGYELKYIIATIAISLSTMARSTLLMIILLLEQLKLAYSRFLLRLFYSLWLQVVPIILADDSLLKSLKVQQNDYAISFLIIFKT